MFFKKLEQEMFVDNALPHFDLIWISLNNINKQMCIYLNYMLKGLDLIYKTQ